MRFCLLILVSLPSLAVSGELSVPGNIKTVVKADDRSGRLVRSVQVVHSIPVTPKQVIASHAPERQETNQEAAVADSSLDLVSLIDRIAAENGVEGSLVHSVIRAESNYNPVALSPKGAEGLMQLIPSTARRFGVRNSFDPKDNVAGGVKYLKFLLEYYKGDYPKAIAAYNAGESAVDRYNGVPPYMETRNYVVQVAKNLKAARAVEARKIAEALPQVAETPKRIETSVDADGKIFYRTP